MSKKHEEADIRRKVIKRLRKREQKERERLQLLLKGLPELYKYTALDDYEDAMQGKRIITLQ